MQQVADFFDLVDGMDLDEEWGKRHLTLDGLTREAREYAIRKNEKLKEGAPIIEGMTVASSLYENMNIRSYWEKAIRCKSQRAIG